jgi:Arc/MetJ-type ribon-helix-helix transcriptional regulator
MEIRPTPDQQAFIRDAIASGRLENAEDAGKEAMALWEERERRRAEILAAVGKAKASIAQGKGRVITQESMRELANEVHQRGLARLAAEQQTSR